ncbi:response regulator PleD [Sphingomonas sp. Leaf357]|uniref:putative bifunctional diguanylate cyclase/phosphodiesterase n=1 Tax=Sphingomonas sp. Leaf357 TaxID=1736350 RepID=UPI0006F78C5F|nr:EAL domain-containing protein [Sphingomonas sp. Leaf357]KQS01830.1 response regulator PleD [Sphingomonas sp. Leaf357]
MEGVTLKSRAVAFAMCAGAVAFILAVFATSNGNIGLDNVARAIIPAIVCAAMCWASAERAISGTAAAVDSAIARLTRAAHGDLESEIPAEIAEQVPQLAVAMRGLFQQLGTNLESVHRLAMFDSVTALPNRTNFRRTCERALSELPQGNIAALFFIDLDRFKSVNDTMGHAMGDMLLGMVANRLRAVADRVQVDTELPPPLIGRLAGDEFTMFVRDLKDIGEAAKIGRAMLFALSEPFDLMGHEVEIGASIGIALRPDHGENLTDLMRAADAAMYHAKACGRGRAEYFTQALADQLADRVTLESDLRRAIDQDQFALVFQPQVSLPAGRIVGAEALLRWQHPRDGLKLPGTFIQRAEETGLIVEIGEWVIATVAETIARWGRMGIEQRLAINIAQRQLDHAAFFNRLRAAMLAAEAPAHLLELEITETLAMHCSSEVIAALELLRADGATIAIDDFGTGYSNLARLRALPVDRIKLHQSLIEHIADSAEARTIAHAVIGLIHSLNCEAVGEGIEHQAQADVLRVIGCDVIQGYAIAQPMDEAEFIAWSRTDERRALAG